MNTAPQAREPQTVDGLVPLLLVVGISFLLLVGHATRYYPFLSDDTLISLRYAHRLLHGHGLTWNDGEAVEGYSNLLWVLANAALGALGFDLIASVRVLGFFCFGVIPVIIIRSMAPKTLPQWYATALVCFILPTCGPVAVWCIGGLEQPLLGLLLAGAVASSLLLVAVEPVTRLAPYAITGIWCGLGALTRPDSPLFAATIGLTVLLWHRTKTVLPGVLCLGVCTGVPVLGQLLFRLAYYGTLVPNTALVKVSFSLHYLALGVRYLRFGYGSLYPLLPVILLVLWEAYRDPVRRGRAFLLVALLVTWSLYLLTIGGDVHPAARHFIPILIFLTFLVAEYAKTLTTFDRMVLTPTVAFLFLFQLASANNRWAALPKEQKLTWDGQSVGLFLRQAFGDLQPLLAVDAAGATPYFSDLPSLDMLGLNDGYLARHPPADLGSGWIGHEIGDFRYVAERAPHCIFFCGALGNETPCFASGRNFVADEAFHARYFLMHFKTTFPEKLDAKAWVRRDMGIVQEANRITIPGYVFSGPDAFVTLVGGLKATLVMGSTGKPGNAASSVSALIVLPPGTWQASSVGSRVEEVPLAWHPRDTVPGPMAGGILRVVSPTPVEIALRFQADGIVKELREVVVQQLEVHPGESGR